MDFGLLTTWWVWIVGGFALGVLEVLAPGFIFLGFAIGAIVTGIAMSTGLFGTSIAPILMVFALASLLSWFVLRRLVGVRPGQVKLWDRDINDN